jgi:mono/diheme cytochrome c family protein
MSRPRVRRLRRPSPVWLAILLLAGGGCQHSGAGSDSQNAEQIFASVCAKCHGADGKGGVPAAEGQNPPRNFCDARFQASRSDDDLKQAIRKGKGGMPAFGNLFSDAELRALVRRLRSFNPAAQGH